VSREYLGRELDRYTEIQVRITNARERISELEALGLETSGKESSELASLKASVTMLLEQRQATSRSIRRLNTRLNWKYD
jgi:hypothetical protein